MREMPAVRAATDGDRRVVVDDTVAAFARDPLVRWFFPDDARWDELGSSFFGTLLDLRLRGGVVDVDAAGRGAAQWEPPGGLAMDEAAVEAAWEPHRALRDAATEERFRLVGGRMAPHVPDEPHWYLGVLAVHPDHHRRGIGSALIAPGLARADDDGVPAFLETATTDNVRLYERHGFVVTAELQLPDGPAVWFMTRHPR